MISRDAHQWILCCPFYILISSCSPNPFKNPVANSLRRFGRLKWISERITFPTCVPISWRWLYVQDVPFHPIWIDCNWYCSLSQLIEMPFEQALNSLIFPLGLRRHWKLSFSTLLLWNHSLLTPMERNCFQCTWFVIRDSWFVICNLIFNGLWYGEEKWLDSFLTLTPTLPKESYIVFKERLLSLSASVIRKWGDILMTSDLACEHEG